MAKYTKIDTRYKNEWDYRAKRFGMIKIGKDCVPLSRRLFLAPVAVPFGLIMSALPGVLLGAILAAFFSPVDMDIYVGILGAATCLLLSVARMTTYRFYRGVVEGIPISKLLVYGFVSDDYVSYLRKDRPTDRLSDLYMSPDYLHMPENIFHGDEK